MRMLELRFTDTMTCGHTYTQVIDVTQAVQLGLIKDRALKLNLPFMGGKIYGVSINGKSLVCDWCGEPVVRVGIETLPRTPNASSVSSSGELDT